MVRSTRDRHHPTPTRPEECFSCGGAGPCHACSRPSPARCSRAAPLRNRSATPPRGTRSAGSTRKASAQPHPTSPGPPWRGDGIRLSDHRGNVVLLNAWASWCGPCRAEAPELKKIQEKRDGRGVDVLGIDNDHSRADALAFQKEFRLTYPSLRDSSGRQVLGLPRGLLNAQSLPFTIVIDRRGKVAAARMGMVTEAETAKLITSLLSVAASGSSELGDRTGAETRRVALPVEP
ncbi:TlpA family protein disulfide reductase [Streptomyces sp. NPDC088725]|uniref:TlpA family protein disulfide reductase n=1 Tax=Streptomyces sp. NPDC088725 TaxID=3365873 RepID=UPI0038009B63